MKNCSDLSLVKSIREEDFRRLIKVKGVDFDEEFLAQLISNYFISDSDQIIVKFKSVQEYRSILAVLTTNSVLFLIHNDLLDYALIAPLRVHQ